MITVCELGMLLILILIFIIFSNIAIIFNKIIALSTIFRNIILIITNLYNLGFNFCFIMQFLCI